MLVVVRKHKQFAMCWSTLSLFPPFFVSTSVLFFITVHNGDIKLPRGNLITSEGVFGYRREILQQSQKKAVEA